MVAIVSINCGTNITGTDPQPYSLAQADQRSVEMGSGGAPNRDTTWWSVLVPRAGIAWGKTQWVLPASRGFFWQSLPFHLV
jgi:hypothetical protein